MFEISVWTYGFLLAAGRVIFCFLFPFGFHGSHKALVLTHEEASQTEKFPYLSVMLRPLQVLEFYGRCASRVPAQAQDEDARGAGRPLLLATPSVVRLTGARPCDAAVAPIHV